MQNGLKLKSLGIGSLPHKNLEDAINIVNKYFCEIPFFPQLKNVNKNEDMILQLLEGMPSFSSDNSDNFLIDSESEQFYIDLEEFFADYEEIVGDINSPKIEKYGISKKFSSTFCEFEKIIKNTKPQYAKGQITGPFTFSTSLKDKNNNIIIYDETLRDISVKLLSLKVLWQIKHIKQANPDTIPIIFMDEPSISQIGTSAYISISTDLIIDMLKEISEIIKRNGGISAIHCCGKCDWRIPIKTNTDILNFDAYSFSQNFSIYHKEIKDFLINGGKIAWGFIPTSDGNILKNLTTEELVEKFKNSVKYLTNNGIDEKLIINNSLITSSCGAGALSEEDAQKAMELVYKLSKNLRERF